MNKLNDLNPSALKTKFLLCLIMCMHCVCVGMCPCLLVPAEAGEHWLLGLELQVEGLGTEFKIFCKSSMHSTVLDFYNFTLWQFYSCIQCIFVISTPRCPLCSRSGPLKFPLLSLCSLLIVYSPLSLSNAASVPVGVGQSTSPPTLEGGIDSECSRNKLGSARKGKRHIN